MCPITPLSKHEIAHVVDDIMRIIVVQDLFRVVRTERREDGIWICLSPNIDTICDPGVYSVILEGVQQDLTKDKINITSSGTVFWVPEARVIHEGLPKPTTCGEYIDIGCPI